MRTSTKKQPSAGAPLWQEAASFAARAHRFQVRKDERTPYVAHVVRVAMTVRQVFDHADPATIAAALLHDTIEDTTTDYEDLRERFGAEVAELVAHLTKNMALPEREREREYDERLARGPWKARLIKMADVFDNLSESRTKNDAAHRRKQRKAAAAAERILAITRSDTPPEMMRARDALRALLGA